MPAPEVTEEYIRIRLRDPGAFVEGGMRVGSTFVTVDLKKDKPRVRAIMGKLRETKATEAQALLFPKEDKWTVQDAQKWARERFGDKKDYEIAEVKAADLPAEVSENADLYEQLGSIVLKDARRIVRKSFDVQVKIADREAHEADIIISSDIVDRDKEVVVPEGLVVGEPTRVPLVAGHGHGDLRKQIGSIEKAAPNGRLVNARAKYLAGKGNNEADWAWVLADAGLAAYSIGFIPIEYEDADLSDENVAKAVRAGQAPIRKYTKWELVEVSQVIVPSNKMALQRLREGGVITAEVEGELVAKGVDETPLDEETEQDLLDLIERFDVLKMFDEQSFKTLKGKEEKNVADNAEVVDISILTDEEAQAAAEAAVKAAAIEKAKKGKKDEKPAVAEKPADAEEEEDEEEDLSDEEREAALAKARADKKAAKEAKAAQEKAAMASPAERLAAGHAERVTTALSHIGKGTDVLKVLIAEQAGPGGAGSPAGGYTQQEHDEATAAGPGGKPKAPESVEVKGEVVVNAETLVKALDAWRADLIKELNSVFEAQLAKAGKTLVEEALPKDSAAFASVKDLIAVVIEGTKSLIDERIAKAVANPKAYRQK